MSREIRTRIRCHRCYYGYVETSGDANDVAVELESRGWGKDSNGRDICATCLEDIDADVKRLGEIRVRQATRLLQVHGLETTDESALRLIQAENAVIEALREEERLI